MEKLKEIALWFSNFGITLYIVGGAIRDELMGLPVSDIDICVVGGDNFNRVHDLLNQFYIKTPWVYAVTPVHGSFPIWIVNIEGERYEFAMARKERKVGQSRQEFECEVNNVTIEEDLERRDLTINAIAKNVVTKEIVDPFDGQVDIENKVAEPVSVAFMEDSLRVYRAARFIAKFNLELSEDLIWMCKKCDHTKISNERVGMELLKMFETAKKPSLFFTFLREIDWLQYHFPELYACIGVPQSPVHHPEGDVFTHTMHCIDAAQGVFQRSVMLCHDLAKAVTTEVDGILFRYAIDYKTVGELKAYPNSKITAHGHELKSSDLCKDMLKRIYYLSHEEIDRIACLVRLHMIRIVINEKNYDKIVRRTLRELMKYKLSYEDLILTVYYDLNGRPPKIYSAIDLCRESYWNYANHLLGTGQMTPIVTGQKLIDLGLEEGPEIGKITKHALKLQDRGVLKEDNWQKVLRSAGYKIFQTKGA